MKNILKLNQITSWRKTIHRHKKVVLVGGCFDVLHPGHVIFLEKAKGVGDILVVLLESDEKVKKLKGQRRPIHNQKERAIVLSALSCVDYIVLLPVMAGSNQYDQLIVKIKPDVIAVTQGYHNTNHHQRAADLVNAKLKIVTKMIGNHSTSGILNR